MALTTRTDSRKLNFLLSALTEKNPFMPTADFWEWFKLRRQCHQFQITQIPFSELEKWTFEHSTGNLIHHSGKFFTIEGIWVETNSGVLPQWSQPIINQPEIGILGILAKKFDGILYFLMQAKMEPGNINVVQLAPTVQATRSNYTKVHQGKTVPYLEYFFNRTDSKILIDVLQSEQGARFLKKRNRNIIIETKADVPLREEYCWLTLGQLHKLLCYDNLLNMDARTVLSCISYAAPELEDSPLVDVPAALSETTGNSSNDASLPNEQFKMSLLQSSLNTKQSLHSDRDILSWFTEAKFRYELDVERIPLKFVKHWHKSDDAISHETGRFFSVIAVSVQADNREVTHWTQPLIKPQGEGIVAYMVKNIKGILHFLVQAKVEPGNFDIAEMAPTVQCITGDYTYVPVEKRPLFLDYVLNAASSQIRVSTLQSEEGGRFFHEQNRNLIIEVKDDFPLVVPENYIWMTLHQLKSFIAYNNFVNVEGRCLLASLGFL